MGFVKTTAAALAATIRHRMPADVSVQAFDPGGAGFPAPLVAVGLPDMSLATYDEGETQLGAFDWDAVWPVTLYVDLMDPETDQALAMDLTERIIEAFHADSTCDGAVEDASVTTVRSGYNAGDTDRRLVVVEFDVATYLPRPT